MRTQRLITGSMCFAASLAILTSEVKVSQAVDRPVYRCPDATVEDRIQDLLVHLTLDEKIEMIGGYTHMDAAGNDRHQ